MKVLLLLGTLYAWTRGVQATVQQLGPSLEGARFTKTGQENYVYLRQVPLYPARIVGLRFLYNSSWPLEPFVVQLYRAEGNGVYRLIDERTIPVSEIMTNGEDGMVNLSRPHMRSTKNDYLGIRILGESFPLYFGIDYSLRYTDRPKLMTADADKGSTVLFDGNTNEFIYYRVMLDDDLSTASAMTCRSMGNQQCHFFCDDEENTFKCFCPANYSLQTDGKTCQYAPQSLQMLVGPGMMYAGGQGFPGSFDDPYIFLFHKTPFPYGFITHIRMRFNPASIVNFMFQIYSPVNPNSTRPTYMLVHESPFIIPPGFPVNSDGVAEIPIPPKDQNMMEKGLVMGIRMIPPFNLYLGVDSNKMYSPLTKIYNPAQPPTVGQRIQFDESNDLVGRFVYFTCVVSSVSGKEMVLGPEMEQGDRSFLMTFPFPMIILLEKMPLPKARVVGGRLRYHGEFIPFVWQVYRPIGGDSFILKEELYFGNFTPINSKGFAEFRMKPGSYSESLQEGDLIGIRTLTTAPGLFFGYDTNMTYSARLRFLTSTSLVPNVNDTVIIPATTYTGNNFLYFQLIILPDVAPSPPSPPSPPSRPPNTCAGVGNRLCSHYCIDRQEGFRCACRVGHVLLPDGIMCVPNNQPDRVIIGPDMTYVNGEGFTFAYQYPVIFLFDKTPFISGFVTTIRSRFRSQAVTPFVFQVYRPENTNIAKPTYRLVYQETISVLPAPNESGISEARLPVTAQNMVMEGDVMGIRTSTSFNLHFGTDTTRRYSSLILYPGTRSIQEGEVVEFDKSQSTDANFLYYALEVNPAKNELEIGPNMFHADGQEFLRTFSTAMTFLFNKSPLQSGHMVGIRMRHEDASFPPFMLQIYRPVSSNSTADSYKLLHETFYLTAPDKNPLGYAEVRLPAQSFRAVQTGDVMGIRMLSDRLNVHFGRDTSRQFSSLMMTADTTRINKRSIPITNDVVHFDPAQTTGDDFMFFNALVLPGDPNVPPTVPPTPVGSPSTCQVTGNWLCEYACVDTPQGFVCSCPTGSVLRSDNRTCQGQQQSVTVDIGPDMMHAGGIGFFIPFSYTALFLLTKTPLPTGTITGFKARLQSGTFFPFHFNIYRPETFVGTPTRFRLIYETTIDSFTSADGTGVSTLLLPMQRRIAVQNGDVMGLRMLNSSFNLNFGVDTNQTYTPLLIYLTTGRLPPVLNEIVQFDLTETTTNNFIFFSAMMEISLKLNIAACDSQAANSVSASNGAMMKPSPHTTTTE
ncbi:hypothetical protein FSP39_011552 [Pinctada imbricata]|uniref:EGF-like domain-containing protein n=1 Tax=Pinctada imbricata TaxID=66713 RepID=A0AA88Y4S7_PINIB|nr:hypothetical protein FSP39_011552 [Pinctada imbricata]